MKMMMWKNCSRLCRHSSRSIPVRFTASLAEEKPFSAIPGPYLLPVIGSSWQFLPIIGNSDPMHLDQMADMYYRKYGTLVRESFGSMNFIHTFDPDHFEIIAKATFSSPRRFGFLALHQYRESLPEKYNSPGILPVNDERWWKLRQVFQKPVSPLKEARDFLSPTDEITKEFVDTLKPDCVIDDFMMLANRLNMELVCKLLFDERLHCFTEEASAPDSYLSTLIRRSVHLAEGLGEIDRYLMMSKHFKGKLYKEMVETLELMEEFSINMLNKVKSRSNLSEDKCILARYINNPEIHEKELLAILGDLLLGGIHTSAITSCFIVYYVSQNPEILSKLKEESRRLLPPGAKITTSTINEAVYTRAVIKETFRLNPIGFAQGRVLPTDISLAGYKIPKNTLMIMQNLIACKQEHNFKDALKFKPERWIKDSPEYEQPHPYIMMPFGLGTRSCIARRRAEQNLMVFTLRMFNVIQEVKWMRDTELGFTTPFMISPEGLVKFKFSMS